MKKKKKWCIVVAIGYGCIVAVKRTYRGHANNYIPIFPLIDSRLII